MAIRIALACNETGALRAIHKADDAVVTQHEHLRELADSRSSVRIAASHREQELVLGRSQTMLHRLLLTPTQELTQAGAQAQKLLVLLVGQLIMHGTNISLCDIGVRPVGGVPRKPGFSMFETLAHTERSRLPPIQAPRARIAPRRGLLVLVVCLALIPASAQAATTHVDGISDQSLPAWNGSFADSSFASFFRTSWVGQIAFARYVVQWNTMAEASSGANPDGDYRERFEAWLKDVRALGLTPVLALTSYNGVYPSAAGEYQREFEQLLTQADGLQAPVAYVEAWNEPNNQGNEPAATAGEIADWADAVCDQRACQLIAGDFEDAPSLPSYEHEYIGALSFSPRIWGIHPYRSVKAHSDVPVLRFEQALPDHGADTQLWFTEIGAYYCLNGQVLGEAEQASDASYLVNDLIPATAPTHVFYYGFMAGGEEEVPCAARGASDSELYRAPGQPRAAAGVVFAGPDRALELEASLASGLQPFD